MKDILFRAKRIDNGEWVYGQLLHFKASVGTDELALIVESCEWDNSNEWFNLGKRAKVNPFTIGQFTGLCDKNGNKIFEGDIVCDLSDLDGDVDVVKFFKGRYSPFVQYPEYYSWDKDECAVIGNIHDNPELLMR